jgi:hypothetical protein
MQNPQSVEPQPVSLDPFVPAEIARRLEAISVQRASLPTRKLVLLAALGGVYIGFGGALATLVATDATLGYGLSKLAAGLAFSLGLFMLVVAGGELFTGNNLMVLAFASRKISSHAVLRNWLLAYPSLGIGAGRGIATAPGRGCRRRTSGVPSAYPLHDADPLHLHGKAGTRRTHSANTDPSRAGLRTRERKQMKNRIAPHLADWLSRLTAEPCEVEGWLGPWPTVRQLHNLGFGPRFEKWGYCLLNRDEIKDGPC